MDVRETFNRIDERLNYDRDSLALARQEFACPTNRRSQRTGAELSRLQDRIAYLSENVRILSRTHAIFADALRRRGEVVGVVKAERTPEPVAVKV